MWVGEWFPGGAAAVALRAPPHTPTSSFSDVDSSVACTEVAINWPPNSTNIMSTKQLLLAPDQFPHPFAAAG